ncbi:MAG: DUF4443 domain-containing protein [Candidatus Methanomethylophilaceae archaeon]|jgi:predicted transcriptional regulator
MKIIDKPRFGPMFRFNDANVYWTLHLLSDGKRMGRKKMADTVGIGEGSMRRIIETLREWGLISIKQTGISITKAGMSFLEQIPIRAIDIQLGDSAVGEYTQGVLVSGVADKIHNGMQQRDAGIKTGALSCTTIVYRDGKLMIPPDWNIDSENPALARYIRDEIEMGPDDIIIVGGADTEPLAVEAAVSAALELL